MVSPQMNPYVGKLNAVRELANLREKALREISDVVMERQASFWEKVSLFNAGAIVLSINFAGSLHEHGGIKGFRILVLAWIVMVCGMTLSLIRNKFHTEYRFWATNRSRLEAAMKVQQAEIEFHQSGVPVVYSDSPEPYDPKKETELAKSNLAKYAEAFEEAEHKEKLMTTLHTTCQRLAPVATLIGVVCMTIVAVLNLRP